MSDERPIRFTRDGQPVHNGRGGKVKAGKTGQVPVTISQAGSGGKIVPPQGGSGTAPPQNPPPKK